MEKRAYFGLGLILLIVAGLSLYALTRPTPAKAPTSLPYPSGKHLEQADYYDIEAYVATSTPLAEPGNASAVALIQQFVSDTIAQFKTDGNFDRLTSKDITALGFDQGRKYSLKILYLISSSPRTVSYIFTTYEDTGGAHPNTFFHTFTFDTTTGKPLALADLFAPRAPYLERLSVAARANLPSIIGTYADSEMIADGTTPEGKNFEKFFLDNGTLDILFAPYAVAPYAAGPQTLQIPLSSLSDILDSTYR